MVIQECFSSLFILDVKLRLNYHGTVNQENFGSDKVCLKLVSMFCWLVIIIIFVCAVQGDINPYLICSTTNSAPHAF